MNAQPGWYDAGVPGRQRWWDGTQWSAHERAVPQRQVTPVQPVQPHQPVQPQAAQVQPQFTAPVAHAAPILAPMGWFPVVGTADVRWWDGTAWAPYRIRDGRVRPDAFAVEPGSTGIMLGILLIFVAVLQYGNYSLSGEAIFAITPLIFILSGVIWLIGGIRVNQLKKLPAPSTVPVFDPMVRPLPGEVEGAGAGWYPVSGRITRWWTGAQWSWYVGQKFGVRPTQSGPRSYRASMIVGWILVGLGVLGAVLGFTVIAAVGVIVGIIIVIPTLVFALVGGLVLLLVYVRRYTLILPPQAPPLR